jgi:hypothetical protein
MVSDVSPLSTLTHPSLGIPAIAAIPSTFFSIPDVSLGTRELGSVVVVVGATVVVVGATVVVVVGTGATGVVVVGAIVVVVVGATVVVVGATVVVVVVAIVVVVGATVVVVGATVVEVVVVVGMVVSIIKDSDGLTAELFPALSVITAVTAHVPSVSVIKSQVDATVES